MLENWVFSSLSFGTRFWVLKNWVFLFFEFWYPVLSFGSVCGVLWDVSNVQLLGAVLCPSLIQRAWKGLLRIVCFLMQDIMPQIRRENHSCTNCTSFKSFIHYVLNSYTTGGYFTPFYRREKRLYQRKLFYKAFSYFPLSKIKQEDSWRWWQSHIDYSCFSTSWCSLPFPSLFPKSFWPASNPSLHRFHIQRQEQHG